MKRKRIKLDNKALTITKKSRCQSTGNSVDAKKNDIPDNASSIEDVSKIVSTLFTAVQASTTSKKFAAVLTELWEKLIGLRLEYKLSLHYDPKTRDDTLSSNAKHLAEIKWITNSFKSLIDHLVVRLEGESKKIAQIALKYLMETVRVECSIRLSHSLPKEGFPIRALEQIVKAILFSKTSHYVDLLQLLKAEYWSQYYDLRYNTVVLMQTLVGLIAASKEKSGSLSLKVYVFLQQLPTPDEIKTMESKSFSPDEIIKPTMSDHLYQDAYVTAWVTFLRMDGDDLRLSSIVYKEILTALPTTLLPFMKTPLTLSRFFLTAFQESDVTVAVQALSGLFYLLVKAKLGEPQLVLQEGENFYSRLLILLQPKSKLLSSNMKAVFIKKLVVVALLAPVSATLWLLSVAYCLLQSAGLSLAPILYQSKIDYTNNDPLTSPQVDIEKVGIQWKDRLLGWKLSSINQNEDLKKYSLWEIDLAKHHWHLSVVQMANLFCPDMFKPTAPRLDPNHYISFDTSTLLAYEIKQLLKKSVESKVRFMVKPR